MSKPIRLNDTVLEGAHQSVVVGLALLRQHVAAGGDIPAHVRDEIAQAAEEFSTEPDARQKPGVA